ncbi:MAG: carbon storage regulator [Planctomycetota bacterium]|nr:MAG: carbon storage regulator [Planctomycetota bacterium]
MLVLTRKVGERIQIGDQITVSVIRIQNGKVRIGIEAPDDVRIRRDEIETETTVQDSFTEHSQILAEEVPLLKAGVFLRF